MSNDNERLLVYFDNEQHLVRRLGAAVVACWSELPPALQTRLIDQAKRVLDETQSDQLDNELKHLLASAQTGR